MLISTDGIVLKTKPLGNDDHVYTILTREKGVITAFARSRQKISRGMGSALELFTYSNFVLFQSKDRYSINSASSNKVFFGIRSDIEKVSLDKAYQMIMDGEINDSKTVCGILKYIALKGRK